MPSDTMRRLAAELAALLTAHTAVTTAITHSSCESRIKCYMALDNFLADYIHVLKRQVGADENPLSQAGSVPPTEEQGPEA